MTYLYIAAGGALGAMARYGFGAMILSLMGASFPYATMITNIVGSFLMGVLIESFALFWNPGAHVQIFLTTGFLAAFTTFSTFSLDFATLYQRGDLMLAFVYVLASVLLSVVALFGGLFFIRAFSG